jgi:hypothetical protein
MSLSSKHDKLVLHATTPIHHVLHHTCHYSCQIWNSRIYTCTTVRKSCCKDSLGASCTVELIAVKLQAINFSVVLSCLMNTASSETIVRY